MNKFSKPFRNKLGVGENEGAATRLMTTAIGAVVAIIFFLSIATMLFNFVNDFMQTEQRRREDDENSILLNYDVDYSTDYGI